MRKILGGLSFGLFILVCVSFGACSKSETYADKVKAERKNIKRFLNERNIVVLDNYPSDSVFKENEFYLDPSGVYINVIDSGNGKRAGVNNRAEVSYRFWDTSVLPVTDTITNNDAVQPLSFTYGRVGTYQTQVTGSYGYAYLSTGVTIPLKYVGENAVVRLIIPFAQGSTYQNQAYCAIYYGKLKYTNIVN